MKKPTRVNSSAALRQHLQYLGELVKVTEEHNKPPEPPPPPKREVKTRPWLIGLAVLTGVVGIVISLMGGGEASDWLPKSLYGAWGTTDVRYRDRQFWIAEKAIAFQTGPTSKELAIYPLLAVRLRPSGGDTTFVALDYQAEGGVVTQSLALIERPKLKVIFPSQALTWTPAIGGTWPTGLERPGRALDFGR